MTNTYVNMQRDVCLISVSRAKHNTMELNWLDPLTCETDLIYPLFKLKYLLILIEFTLYEQILQ